MMKILGRNAKIHKDAFIDSNLNCFIGDNCVIGPWVRIVGSGTFTVGDYSKIHFGTFVNIPENKTVSLGHNCWIGERSVLDGDGNLEIKNNVCVGFNSQLLTHFGHGDVMEGCNFFSKKKMTIENDVWIAGNCTISPVNIAQKALILPGSVVTKNLSENRVYGGVPSQDITEKIGVPWTAKPLTEKLSLFEGYVRAFKTQNPNWDETIVLGVLEFPKIMDSSVTYFNVTTREYTKRYSEDEIKFMTWLTSWKARFIPKE